MNKLKERILCIKTDVLFSKEKWNGLLTKDLDYYYDLLLNQSEFRVREDLELDPSFKQIIPQVILRYTSDKPRYFLHQNVSGSEKRLNKLFPLPLGGHVEEFDKSQNDDLIQTALYRELQEEVEIVSNIIKKEFLGIVYLEDDNPVNHVHIGLFYIFDLDGSNVSIKELGELEEVGFVDLNYLKENKEILTYWSRVVLDRLE